MDIRIFESLQLNITNVKDMILIDKCMNSTNEEGNFFDAWKILVNKYEPKTQLSRTSLCLSSITSNKILMILVLSIFIKLKILKVNCNLTLITR